MKRHIPDPRVGNALSVCDGHETVGFIVEDDKSFFAFDREATLIGEYPTCKQATRAIPPHQKESKR